MYWTCTQWVGNIQFIVYNIRTAHLHALRHVTSRPRCPCRLRKKDACPNRAAPEDRSEIDHLHATDSVDRCYFFSPELR